MRALRAHGIRTAVVSSSNNCEMVLKAAGIATLFEARVEGIHLGAMGGTVDLVQRVSTGIEVAGDVLRLNPKLPEELDRLEMRIRYRGHSLELHLTRESLAVHGRDRGPGPIQLGFKKDVFEFSGGQTRVFHWADADPEK